MVCTRNHSTNRFSTSLNYWWNHFSAPSIIDIDDDESNSHPPLVVHAARSIPRRHRRSLTSVETEDTQIQSDVTNEIRYNVLNSHSIFPLLTYPIGHSIETNTVTYNDAEPSNRNEQPPSSQTSATARSRWKSSN